MIFGGDRGQIGPYLRELADLMGLRDWEICVLDGVPDHPQHQADIDTRYGRRVASIRFADDWSALTPAIFRATCVHELLHCHLNIVRNPLDNMAGAIGELLYKPADASLSDYLEVAIDSIATAWAETLPLPVKARPKRKKAEAA